jgi:hypothetical protein
MCLSLQIAPEHALQQLHVNAAVAVSPATRGDAAGAGIGGVGVAVDAPYQRHALLAAGVGTVATRVDATAFTSEPDGEGGDTIGGVAVAAIVREAIPAALGRAVLTRGILHQDL